MPTLAKDTRLHIRCDQEIRRLLDKAAAYAHMSVSECGEVALDEYLQRYASQDIKRGVARVFVASPGAPPQGVAAASEALAVAAIVVDAKSPKAAAFCQHFGFFELPGQPGRWMLPRSRLVGLT